MMQGMQSRKVLMKITPSGLPGWPVETKLFWVPWSPDLYGNTHFFHNHPRAIGPPIEHAANALHRTLGTLLLPALQRSAHFELVVLGNVLGFSKMRHPVFPRATDETCMNLVDTASIPSRVAIADARFAAELFQGVKELLTSLQFLSID